MIYDKNLLNLTSLVKIEPNQKLVSVCFVWLSIVINLDSIWLIKFPHFN